MKYYSAIKNNEVLPFAATQMDLETIILSEVREKDRYCMINYMWNLKKKMIQRSIFTKQTHRHRKQTYGY